MTPERIVALIIGVGAIGFGALTWRYARAWHQKHPPDTAGFGVSDYWPRRLGILRLPVIFTVVGALLVMFGLFRS